jgi:hypothetical protein
MGPLYWILGIGFVVGLAVHAGGFLLKTSVTTEPPLPIEARISRVWLMTGNAAPGSWQTLAELALATG